MDSSGSNKRNEKIKKRRHSVHQHVVRDEETAEVKIEDGSDAREKVAGGVVTRSLLDKKSRKRKRHRERRKIWEEEKEEEEKEEEEKEEEEKGEEEEEEEEDGRKRKKRNRRQRVGDVSLLEDNVEQRGRRRRVLDAEEGKSWHQIRHQDLLSDVLKYSGYEEEEEEGAWEEEGVLAELHKEFVTQVRKKEILRERCEGERGRSVRVRVGGGRVGEV